MSTNTRICTAFTYLFCLLYLLLLLLEVFLVMERRNTKTIITYGRNRNSTQRKSLRRLSLTQQPTDSINKRKRYTRKSRSLSHSRSRSRSRSRSKSYSPNNHKNTNPPQIIEDSEDEIIMPKIVKKPRKVGFYGNDNNHISSKAHHGREESTSKNTQGVKQLKWMKAAPGHSLCLIGGKIYCQACQRFTHDSKSGMLRHCGLDTTKAGQKTNKGLKHNKKVQKWKNGKRLENISNVGIGSGWIRAAVIEGLNFSQTANFAKRLCDKFTITNGGEIAKNAHNVYSKLPNVMAEVKEDIKRNMNKSKPFSIFFDATPDKWTDQEVLTIMYSEDANKKPITCQLKLTADSIDAQLVFRAIYGCDKFYRWVAENCIAINLDSTNYCKLAFKQLRMVFCYSVILKCLTHLIYDSLKAAFGIEQFKIVIKWLTEAYNLFAHRITLRNELKRFYAEQCEPVNPKYVQQLDELLSQITDDEAAEIFDENVGNLFDLSEKERSEIISTALKSRINLNGIPPKYIASKYKSIGRGILYFVVRFVDICQFVIQRDEIPDDNWIKNQIIENDQLKDIHLLITAIHSFIQRPYVLLYWSEGYGYKIHKCYDKIETP
eukprot:480663_1